MSVRAISWAFQQRLDDPTAKLVLIGIADKYNEDRGYAWPSVDSLADMADCTRRTVSRKIGYLEELKLIQIIRSPSQTSRYYLPAMTNCHDDTGVRGVMTPDVMGGMTPDVTRTIENDSERKESLKTLFDRFWEVVPRKVGKKAAMTAFKAAVKSVDAEALISGMDRYAKKVRSERTEARYIVHPTTWLQQGRWDDEEAAVVTAPVTGSRDWVPETQEEFEKEVMANDYRRDWLLQNRPGIFHHAIAKGWISERPKQQRTFG